MKFTKMNGAGNDFIIIDNRDGSIPASVYGRLAKTLCERRFSIGADGMIIVGRPVDGRTDLSMRFFNRDGSPGEMCGNGARCICRYAADHGISGILQRVGTDSGIVTGEKITTDEYRMRINGATKTELHKRLSFGGEVYDCAYIELGLPGLPHLVLNIPGLAGRALYTLKELGLGLVHHPELEKGANVNFYDIPDMARPSEIVIRTCERFVDDFTFACGTGASATALTLRLLGGEPETYALSSPGGLLTVELVPITSGNGYDIYLTGPVCSVSEGDILDVRALRLLSEK